MVQTTACLHPRFQFLCIFPLAQTRTTSAWDAAGYSSSPRPLSNRSATVHPSNRSRCRNPFSVHHQAPTKDPLLSSPQIALRRPVGRPRVLQQVCRWHCFRFAWPVLLVALVILTAFSCSVPICNKSQHVPLLAARGHCMGGRNSPWPQLHQMSCCVHMLGQEVRVSACAAEFAGWSEAQHAGTVGVNSVCVPWQIVARIRGMTHQIRLQGKVAYGRFVKQSGGESPFSLW